MYCLGDFLAYRKRHLVKGLHKEIGVKNWEQILQDSYGGFASRL